MPRPSPGPACSTSTIQRPRPTAETDCEGDFFEKDVWFAWTADFSGPVTLETCGQTDIDTLVAAYDLLPCPPSPHLACNDDACGFLHSRILWTACAGHTYLIRIGGFDGGGGSGTFTIATTPSFGGCCLPDGSCIDQSPCDCDANDGVYQGDGLTCAGSCLLKPSGFSYQGKLDLLGSPLDGTADFDFTLWDDPGAGNMIGSVVAVSNVTLVDGLFTVVLNSGDEFGPNAFNGAPRWLEIDVRSPAGGGEFTTLSPRQPVTATPSAIHSRSTRGISVDSLGNVSTTGNVGIGTNAPTTPLAIMGNGGTTPIGITQNSVGGAATMELTTEDAAGAQATRVLLRGGQDTADVEFYTGASGAETQTMHIEGTNGNVGIGTPTPGEKLDVQGELRFGSNAEFYPAPFDRKTVIVAGKIKQNGDIDTTATTSNAISSASNTNTGLYTVTFAANTFAVTPLVTVTVFDTAGGDNRIATLRFVDTGEFRIRIVNPSGSERNSGFNFIAIGER